jgi:hypothetical protein
MINPMRLSPELAHEVALLFAMRGLPSAEAVELIDADFARLIATYPVYASWLRYKGWSWKAIAYESAGRHRDAVESLVCALRERAPESWERTAMYLNLGALYLRLGEQEKAACAWNRGITVGARRSDSTVLLILQQMAQASILVPNRRMIDVLQLVSGISVANTVSVEEFRRIVLAAEHHAR